MAITSSGMGISGFTSQVLLSVLPFGKTFRMEISTIRSFATFVPVVSKSKKHMGLVSFNCILSSFLCKDSFYITKEKSNFTFLTTSQKRLHVILLFNIICTLNLSVNIPGFQIIGNCLYKHTSQGAINHPMIIAVRQKHLAANTNKISLRGFYYRRHFTNCS